MGKYQRADHQEAIDRAYAEARQATVARDREYVAVCLECDNNVTRREYESRCCEVCKGGTFELFA